MEKNIIRLPLDKDQVGKLNAGEYYYLTGEIYTARDAAHGRMCEQMADALGVSVAELLTMKDLDKDGEEKLRSVIPIDIRDQVIYYLGPTPAREGQVIGSAGPTTSSRMDKYAPLLIRLGLTGMIGKGRRSDSVVDAMKKYGAVYFAAVGGAGALLSQCIKSSEVIAYDDLGTESIRKLYVEELPVITVIDQTGKDQYASAIDKWKR